MWRMIDFQHVAQTLDPSLILQILPSEEDRALVSSPLRVSKIPPLSPCQPPFLPFTLFTATYHLVIMTNEDIGSSNLVFNVSVGHDVCRDTWILFGTLAEPWTVGPITLNTINMTLIGILPLLPPTIPLSVPYLF